MDSIEPHPLIISASRTKDMVHRSPDILADILSGQAECRWGPHGPTGTVDPAQVHSVVLWTKDPSNLLCHDKLRNALQELQTRYQALIALEVTATGLGGSFIEPGIPPWRQVYQDLRDLLSEGWINPQAVVYRYDPFLRIESPGGNQISNASLPLFERLCREFISLGITRVTTSRVDTWHYPRVEQRLEQLGLKMLPPEDAEAVELCQGMAEICRKHGAEFSICCDPPVDSLIRSWGCIDARRLNRVKGADQPQATEILHNRIGKQRPACRCTYSRDIGYSAGSATCFSGGYGCLYCYSQGGANLPNLDAIRGEINAFDADPGRYLSKVTK
ncbi:MAG: DUF1848 family protein [bacterium]|nr:DUF1848 family protein [bacterium]